MQEKIDARRLRRGEAAFNCLYRSYLGNSRRKNIAFLLSKAQFKKLTKGTCYLCGSPPSQVCWGHSRTMGPYKYNGIDRVDNSIGYEKKNCKPCCSTCNQIKSSRSVEELKAHIAKILSHEEV